MQWWVVIKWKRNQIKIMTKWNRQKWFTHTRHVHDHTRTRTYMCGEICNDRWDRSHERRAMALPSLSFGFNVKIGIIHFQLSNTQAHSRNAVSEWKFSSGENIKIIAAKNYVENHFCLSRDDSIVYLILRTYFAFNAIRPFESKWHATQY